MPFEVQHQVEIPEGVLLQAVLIELEPKEITFNDRSTGQPKTITKLTWIFEITQSGDFMGMKVRAETSAYLSDGRDNRFRAWAEALLDSELKVGQVLHESDLIGLPALITVGREQDRKDPSKSWRRVQDVISAGVSTARQGAEPPF